MHSALNEKMETITPPLERLSVRVPVSALAKRHYNIIEAGAVIRSMRKSKNITNGGVIGTTDTRRPELYGWNNPVETHIDSKDSDSWMYALVLLTGRIGHIGSIDPVTGKRYFASVRQGDVFRLNDRLPHWTTGSGDTVCVMVGCWPEPNDSLALTMLERAARRLETGNYNAPRVSPAFRVMREFECWALDENSDNRAMMRIAAAKRFGHFMIPCANCQRPAAVIDSHFPYYWDGNTCMACQSRETA